MGDPRKQVAAQMGGLYLSDGSQNVSPMNLHNSQSEYVNMQPFFIRSDPYKPPLTPVVDSQSETDGTGVVYPRGTTVKFSDPKDQERYERMHGERLDREARRLAQIRGNQGRIFPRVTHPNAPIGYGPPPTFKQISQSLYWLEKDYGCSEPHCDTPTLAPLNVPQVPPLPIMFDSHDEGLRRREQSKENADKYMRLLNATENFYAGEWKRSDMTAIFNGIHPSSISPCTIAAAEYAVSFLNQHREDDDEIEMKRLIRVNGQFLRCSIYWLTMEASDEKFYEALVLVSDDEMEKELKFIRPAKYYPEIPAHLHHLIGPPPGEEQLSKFSPPAGLFDDNEQWSV